MITYFKLKHDIWGDNMNVLLRHLNTRGTSEGVGITQ